MCNHMDGEGRWTRYGRREKVGMIWKEREGGHDMEGDGLTSCKTL